MYDCESKYLYTSTIICMDTQKQCRKKATPQPKPENVTKVTKVTAKKKIYFHSKANELN